MKTKLSKKLLSAFLAILMVVTSIPMMAFSALADDFESSSQIASTGSSDPKVLAVEAAMDRFETALDEGGKTNTTQAYTAYVNCQKAIDAYLYGGETDALDGIADAMDAAIANMGTFTQKTASTNYMLVYSGESETSGRTTMYNSALWVETDATNKNSRATGSSGLCQLTLYYPEVTWLYDGTSTISTALVAQATGTGTTKNKTRYVYSIVTTNDELSVNSNWGAQSAYTDWDVNWNAHWADSELSYLTTGFNNASAKQIYTCANWAWSTPTITMYSMANDAYYSGTMSSTEYLKSVTPSVKGYFGSDTSFRNDDITVSLTGDTELHLVNYKALLDKMDSEATEMKVTDLTDYSEGGLASYFAAKDNATSFDPNTYFKKSNDYQGCADKIKELVTAYDNATNTEDIQGYQDIRDAMTMDMINQVSKGNTGYTADTWKDFISAYENCQAIMASCNDDTDLSKGYTTPTATCTAFANKLTEAYAALETDVNFANVDALYNLISNFKTFDSSFFTDATYTPVSTTINDIIVKVWGSTDDFGVKTSVQYYEDEQADIDAFVETINSALLTLRVNVDYTVATKKTAMSINDATAILSEVEHDADYYSNYSTLATTVSTATDYVNAAPTTDFTDYATMLQDYKDKVNAVADAFLALKPSFANIEDGTVYNQTTASISTLTQSHANGNQSMDFSYTKTATIIKTTHDASSVNFGTSFVKFGTTNANSSRVNNMLDSISINATYDANNEFNKGNNDKPSELSDTQKETYAGCLTQPVSGSDTNKFTLTDFRVYETSNNQASYYGIDQSGNQITSLTSDQYTSMLGTTDGTGTAPCSGGVFAISAKSDTWGTITMQSDITLDIPATSSDSATGKKADVTNTVYTSDGYSFGALTVWNIQSGAITYQGYSAFNSGDDKVSFRINVVDISYYIDLVNQCNQLVKDQTGNLQYTQDSWDNFVEKLTAAKEDINYEAIDAATLTTRIGGRYANLYTALNALEYQTYSLTFNYKDASGNDTSTVIDINYKDGNCLNDYADAFNAIVTPSYVADNKTWTFTDWDPAIVVDSSLGRDDLNLKITSDMVYNAVYDGVYNAANFVEFNSAKATLLGELTTSSTPQYTVAQLEAIAEQLKDISYFTYTDEQKSATLADVQDAIDSQKDALNSITEALTPSGVDATAAKATDEYANAVKNDCDRYDTSVFDFEYTQDVVIGKDSDGSDIVVTGLVFADEDALDQAIRDALNNLQVRNYQITLNGEVLSGYESVPYGTTVTIDAFDGANAAWTYSYDAPSREGAGATEAKYVATTPSYTFTVKGNTYLTAVNVEDEDATTYLVTVKSSTGKTIDVATTNGEYTMPTAPLYSNYSFTGYSNGASAGDVITVTENTTIIAQYDAVERDSFLIDVCNSLDEWYDIFDNGPQESYNVPFNTKITLSSPGAYCWVAATYDETAGDDGELYFSVIAYTDEYSFYACKDYSFENDVTALVPMTQDEYETIVSDQTQVNAFSGEVSVADGTWIYMKDSQNNIIFADAVGDENSGYKKQIGTPKATVSSLDKVRAIYDGSKVDEFTMIGTFTLPENVQIVECGFLFTTDTTLADPTVEDVGNTSGLYRFKSTRYTVGNQFVIGIKNVDKTVEFEYRAYATVLDEDGNMKTYYGATYQGNNIF